MSHFAKIENNKVTEVIVAEEDYIKNKKGQWLECSYNTSGGVHRFGGNPLRMNFPSTGFNYDQESDAFYSKSPHKGWILNKKTYIWESPTPKPEHEKFEYVWSDDSESWELSDLPISLRTEEV